jgi:hypothetical protein
VEEEVVEDDDDDDEAEEEDDDDDDKVDNEDEDGADCDLLSLSVNPHSVVVLELPLLSLLLLLRTLISPIPSAPSPFFPVEFLFV